MATPKKLDATRIYERLYQGSYPKDSHAPYREGFDVVVLAAKELQRPSFLGVRTIYCPLDDAGNPMTTQEWQMAQSCAIEVAKLHKVGAKILVTCAQGKNRSGLITALALHLISGLSPIVCAGHIQGLRADALNNEFFLSALASIS